MSAMRNWLARARVTDTACGDLIADMRRDLDIPDAFRSLKELRCYLQAQDACPAALALAPQVWRRYRHWLARR